MMFHKDLDILYQWSLKWSLSFNFSKCRTMNISRNAGKMPSSVFYMNGNLLENSNSEKYLGLHISNDLSWDKHIDVLVKDAYKKLGVISRIFGQCGKYVKSRLYNQLILPKLDYCCSVWSPHLKGLQYILEKVQKRATQIVIGNYHDNYCTLLKTLNWLPLHVMTRNTVLYKILNKYIDIYKLNIKKPILICVEILFSLVLSKAGTCYQNILSRATTLASLKNILMITI